MNLNLNQKAELDALVNFFGGKSSLILRWKKDRLIQSLRRRGLTRWGKVRAFAGVGAILVMKAAMEAANAAEHLPR